MPAWYWAIYWTMPIIGLFLWWYRAHMLTGVYMGVFNLLLIPLMYKKAPPGFPRLLAVLCFAVLAASSLWTALGGSSVVSGYAIAAVLIAAAVSAMYRIFGREK